jgi:DNA-binding XRE family transcriptional regulator
LAVQVTAPNLELGRLIAQARARRGWSQPELARRLGEHRHAGQITRIERGYGCGWAALLELIQVLPEIGGGAIRMIRRAQRARLAERRQQH